MPLKTLLLLFEVCEVLVQFVREVLDFACPEKVWLGLLLGLGRLIILGFYGSLGVRLLLFGFSGLLLSFGVNMLLVSGDAIEHVLTELGSR